MESLLISKLPEELRAKYLKHARKASPAIEGLKNAAALKLWNDRGVRDIKFDVPKVFEGKTMFIKVLAKHQDGTTFGIECASKVKMGLLRERLLTLQFCLPKDSYIIAVFPEIVGAKADKAATLVDEVWMIGKNGKVNQMMFHSYLGSE